MRELDLARFRYGNHLVTAGGSCISYAEVFKSAGYSIPPGFVIEWADGAFELRAGRFYMMEKIDFVCKDSSLGQFAIQVGNGEYFDKIMSSPRLLEGLRKLVDESIWEHVLARDISKVPDWESTEALALLEGE